MKRLTVLDGYAMNPGDLSWDRLKESFEIEVYDRTPADKVIERIGNSDAILVNKVSITDEIMAACPNLKYIGVNATGYNVIDTDAAHKRSITVTNVPAYSTDAVAQHVFAFITSYTNKVYEHSISVKNKDWVNCPDFCYWNSPLMELSGKTLGIFGYGSIGKKVSEIGKAFGMKVIACSRTPKDGVENVTFDQLLEKSDFISLHSPLTPQTTGLINKENLSKMKKSAVLINTARGALVAEPELAEALNKGIIAAYYADVVTNEPMAADNPLLNAKNCYITPHLAWAPLETRQRLMNVVVENITAWLNGKPQNVV